MKHSAPFHYHTYPEDKPLLRLRQPLGSSDQVGKLCRYLSLQQDCKYLENMQSIHRYHSSI